MHVILLALGLVIALAGLALIGLGIPNNTAVPGSTFIVSGTVALVGGLVRTGLASAIRQLRRIAQLLEARPVPRALLGSGWDHSHGPPCRGLAAEMDPRRARRYNRA